jgi:hypothetical protein
MALTHPLPRIESGELKVRIESGELKVEPFTFIYA